MESLEDKAQRKKYKMTHKIKNKKGNLFERRETLRVAKNRISNFLERNNTTNFDKAILNQIDQGRFPEWTKELIEWEANPVDTRSMNVFCQETGAHPQQIVRLRRKYPGYWTAVKYKQRTFMAELGSIAIKTLATRMIISDRALELALIITGQFTPTMKHQIEELSPDVKRQRIEQMLEEIKKTKEVGLVVNSEIVDNGSTNTDKT